MQPEDSLPCSQKLATGSYPEVDESSPHLINYTFYNKFQYYILIQVSIL